MAAAALGSMDLFGSCALREVELEAAQRLCDNKANVGKEVSSLEVSFHKADVVVEAEVGPKLTASSQPKSQTESRDASGTSSLRTSRAPSERKEEDAIVIEERRRRAGGDGYTTHRYVRGRMLGKGGFAKVYHCTSMDTGKNYAVKIVPKANLVKARARQKLQTEIKIHRTLKHENICEYKHFFEDRDNCYILLELCHSQSMNEMIKRRKRFTEPEAAFFMSQLLDALQYIHDQNVIHRDLKLGNLFLDKQLNIKVGDLGLATRLEDKDEKRKTICGTPNYIAPEVIQNDKAKRGHSFEVDVWSMGVILFTVLVGKPPYEAKDVKGTYQRILANEYCFPEHVTVSEDAKDLIMSMLKTDPKERPSLDAITRHSFLSDLSRPEYLPHSCLHTAPVWCRTEFGQLVTQEDWNVVKPKKSMISGGSTRLPFAHHDANLVRQKPSSTVKDTVEIRNVVNQRTPTAFPTPPGNPSTFKIFDEAANRNHTASTRSVTSVGSTENLMARTKALTLSTGKKAAERLRAERSIAKSPVNLDHQEEAQFLYTQLERLGDVLQITESRKGQYRPLTPTSMRNGSLPETWVVRYVDYTSKYGLGFLLSNGSSGVFFNDSTKIALDQDGSSFQYVERKRTDASAVGRVDVLSGSHSLSTYPENLNKKVTLLKHFRNYLMEQQKKEGEDTSVTGVQGASAEFGKQDQVYVKKWLRTKHAILFWLSINVLQVVFFDQTEVILTEDDSSIVYVDKMQRRQSFDFTDEVVGSFPELEKRVKYSRDILKQLLNGQRS